MKEIPLDQIHKGPIRRQLALAFVARVERLRLTLNEVYPSPVTDWLDDFARDLHPEREIEWWERLAECYVSYTAMRNLSARTRQTVFNVCFAVAMGEPVERFKEDLNALPEGFLDDIKPMLDAPRI